MIYAAAVASLLFTLSPGVGCASIPSPASPASAVGQGTSGFVQVEGSSLQARYEAALARGRSSERFWIGYQFDVRPGVSLSPRRNDRVEVNGVVISGAADRGTRNAGVLMLFDRNGNLIDLELRDLDIAHDYARTPVYWIGRASTAESLALLTPIASGKQFPSVTEEAIGAVGVHAGSEPGALIERIVVSEGTPAARGEAVTWLGILGGRTQVLASIVRNPREPRDLREDAATALGISDDPQALSTLRALFDEEGTAGIREEILTAIAIRSDKDGEAVTDALIDIAERGTDREVRKTAIFWLGERAGERAFATLGETAEDESEDIEVRKQAIFAIGQREPDEAIPVLMRAASSNSNREVRKQAIFWLSQIDDPRVLEFLKELLQQ